MKDFMSPGAKTGILKKKISTVPLILQFNIWTKSLPKQPGQSSFDLSLKFFSRRHNFAKIRLNQNFSDINWHQPVNLSSHSFHHQRSQCRLTLSLEISLGQILKSDLTHLWLLLDRCRSSGERVVSVCQNSGKTATSFTQLPQCNFDPVLYPICHPCHIVMIKQHMIKMTKATKMTLRYLLKASRSSMLQRAKQNFGRRYFLKFFHHS